MEPTVRCAGCGAWVPATPGPTHRYMLSAPGCWGMYGRLTAELLSDPAAAGARQWCIDAYAVQHPGEPNQQAIQSVAAHLLSLYATIELHSPPAASHQVINRVTARKGHYIWLPPPVEFDLTVHDVLAHRDQLSHGSQQWARSAWDAWQSHHGQIETWYRRLFA